MSQLLIDLLSAVIKAASAVAAAGTGKPRLFDSWTNREGCCRLSDTVSAAEREDTCRVMSDHVHDSAVISSQTARQ